jgi:hypothetical protein
MIKKWLKNEEKNIKKTTSETFSLIFFKKSLVLLICL